MNLSFISQLYVPIVMAACLSAGYCIKHISYFDKLGNQYIPAILAVLGAALACVNAGSISLDLIVSGAVTGLASTGLYEAFTNLITKGKGVQ